MIVGIIGMGEVGGAIKKLCEKKHEVYWRTRSEDTLSGKQIDILHLCFPFNENFKQTAIDAINELRPKLVINDSSVEPGVTEDIYSATNTLIVHAPIIGKHPDLYKYLFELDKIIGPINDEAFQLAKLHFEDLGVKTVRFNSPRESELAKILSTTYYGWNIIFEKFVHRLCKEQGLEFDNVYTKLNTLYNEGYAKTLPYVRRPVLKHEDGEIGGHCIVPNARIINSWINDEFTQFLLAQNEKAKAAKE